MDKPAETTPGSWRDELKTARHTATGPIDFWTQSRFALSRRGFLFGCICGTMSVPCSMLISGAINIDRCPYQPLVPIWMIVGGSVALATMIANALDIGLYWCTNRGPGHDLATQIINGITAVVILFLIAWLIAGSVWVFGIWRPDTSDSTSATFCYAGIYYYAFAMLIVGYVVTAGLTMCCGHIFCSDPPNRTVSP